MSTREGANGGETEKSKIEGPSRHGNTMRDQMDLNLASEI